MRPRRVCLPVGTRRLRPMEHGRDKQRVDRAPFRGPSGLVERVTFHNAETGFCVLRVKSAGKGTSPHWSATPPWSRPASSSAPPASVLITNPRPAHRARLLRRAQEEGRRRRGAGAGAPGRAEQGGRQGILHRVPGSCVTAASTRLADRRMNVSVFLCRAKGGKLASRGGKTGGSAHASSCRPPALAGLCPLPRAVRAQEARRQPWAPDHPIRLVVGSPPAAAPTPRRGSWRRRSRRGSGNPCWWRTAPAPAATSRPRRSPQLARRLHAGDGLDGHPCGEPGALQILPFHVARDFAPAR